MLKMNPGDPVCEAIEYGAWYVAAAPSPPKGLSLLLLGNLSSNLTLL